MTSVEPDAQMAPETAAAQTAEVDALGGGAGQAALRGSILRTGSYVLTLLLSLASARVLLSHLGKSFEGYGVVTALITIVAGFTEGGLNSVVLREFATLSGERRRQMMATAIGIRLVLTFVGVLLAIAFSFVAGYSGALVAGTALAGAGLIFQLMQSTLATTLQAQLRFGWMSVAELLRQVVNVGLLVLLATGGAGLVTLLAVSIPASLISLLVTIPLVTRYTSLRPSFHLGHWWELLRETAPWAIVAAVSIVYFRVAIVLMSLIAGETQTYYFATSFRITEVLIGIPNLVVVAAFPILARAVQEDSARFDSACGRIFELALVAGTLLVVCLEVGAGFAIHAISGPDQAIGVLRIQGLALIATFVAVSCGYPLLMQRRYREVLLSNVIALLISGILTLSLALPFGAHGTAVAALVAEIGLAASQVIMLKRVAPGVRMPLATAGAVALAGAAGAGAGLLLPVNAIFGVLVASAVYLAVLRLLGRIPPEVGELLGGRLSSLVR